MAQSLCWVYKRERMDPNCMMVIFKLTDEIRKFRKKQEQKSLYKQPYLVEEDTAAQQ